jgi:uncharacterized membrane protein YphA (DoxX/SURF4 family)
MPSKPSSRKRSAPRLDRLRGAAPLLLRLAVGVVLLSRGPERAFARAIHVAGAMVRPLGYVELLAAALLTLGLFTRWAGLATALLLALAVTGGHWAYGLRGPGGFELPLVLCAGSLALVLLGGGWLSVDRHVLGRE